jgi:hypothetical protein
VGPSGSSEQAREADPAPIGEQRVDEVVAEDPADRTLVVVDDEDRRAA